MKKLTIICFISLILLLAAPIISIYVVGRVQLNSEKQQLISQSDNSFLSAEERTVAVFLETSERKIIITELEYVCGVVACEMPMSYEDEALKAQAVAAFTMLRQRQEKYAAQNVSGSDKDFVISSSASTVQGYITQEQMKAKWDSDFDKHYTRLKNIVASVADEYIAYGGEPILAAYHSISCGTTEDAGNVWGGRYPYLSPVSSANDSSAAGYSSEAEFSKAEFKKICTQKLKLTLGENIGNWLGDSVRSESGYVLSCKIGGESFTGQKIRNAFGLRSACFTLKYSDGKFVFNVRGYGHGVGMSQYGANEMAKQGATYQEIIAHYYQDTEILKI